MLEELTAKNLLSFRDEVSLSFEATNDTMGEEQLVTTMPDGKRLLRLAMIYGANASGKTNVLMALDWLKRYWTFAPKDIDKPTGFIAHLVNGFFDVVTLYLQILREVNDFPVCVVFYADNPKFFHIFSILQISSG